MDSKLTLDADQYLMLNKYTDKESIQNNYELLRAAIDLKNKTPDYSLFSENEEVNVPPPAPKLRP
jgi:hypothetical protein